SLSVHRSGCPLGSHAWILIAMFHLAMDLASCQPPATGTGARLSPRPALRHRLSRGSLWGTGSGEELQRPGPPWTCAPAPHLPWSVPLASVASSSPGGWGPVDLLPSASCRSPSAYTSCRRMAPGMCWDSGTYRSGLPCLGWASLLTCHAWARAATTLPEPIGTCSHRHHPLGTPGVRSLPPGLTSRRWGASERWGASHFPIPTVSFLLSAGLAVHQIITITVSLIMVIAALITTLVLKNCCAQSGRPRRNSHQRKLDQQEESCQNLTDFAPARVPSALDIFTAYNETLQCSHECVRTPVPVYAEDTLHSPGDYKTTFNGNRPSSSDRHLIPVAFVSEKWFEISC
ncbi:AJAP1 protein, partial [Peucedramus taeniatus]|nr:AJAP1 protein [Peucedramus taeniatus]